MVQRIQSECYLTSFLCTLEPKVYENEVWLFSIWMNKNVFLKVDCPDGELGKDKILDMYSMILPVGNAKVFVDQIFRIFDKDGNGTIDFKVQTY